MATHDKQVEETEERTPGEIVKDVLSKIFGSIVDKIATALAGGDGQSVIAHEKIEQTTTGALATIHSSIETTFVVNGQTVKKDEPPAQEGKNPTKKK